MKQLFKKSNLFILLGTVLTIILLVIYEKNNPKVTNHKLPVDPDEAPEEIISKEEQAVNQRRRERYSSKLNLKSVGLNEDTSYYADGKLKGVWFYKKMINTGKKWGYGYRTIYSAYDQMNDIIYAVSYAGHLWKITRDEEDYSNTRWYLMNHKDVFMNEYSKKILECINFPDSSMRMIRSFKAGSTNTMQYSDNEGRSWSDATGVNFEDITYASGTVINTTTGHQLFVAALINGSYKAAKSTDGINYSLIDFDINYNDHDLKMLKPCHSDNLYLLVRKKSSSKLSIYKLKSDLSGFTLLHSDIATVSGLSRIFGTYHEDAFHFYVVNENKNIFYSDDEGATWTQTRSEQYHSIGDRNPRTVHPNNPGILFSGYINPTMLTNFGANASNFGNAYLGWDMHHMKMHKKTDGTYFHLVGSDFGVHISYTPDIADSYIQINNTSPIQMAYDGIASENFGTAFTACQDRGTRGFNDDTVSWASDIRSTDGLRVCLANNEKSVWTWMYFGSMYYKPNQGYKVGNAVSKSFTDDWWAAPIIASPNPEEDAIYAAYGSNLVIFSYNDEKGWIEQSDHPFDFSKLTSSEISSFGYSTINRKLWYVTVKSGVFYYSTDGGESFTKSNYGGIRPTSEGSYKKNQIVIKASKINENKVYYAGVGNVFLISEDNGKTFTNHNNGLDVYRIRDFDMSPDEKYIFASCAYGGAWVYAMDDDKWYEMNDEAVPYVDFTAVQFLANKNVVQFSTYGNGMMDFYLSNYGNQLARPKNAKATSISHAEISLEWQAASNEMDGYIIERSTDLLTFEPIDSVSAGIYNYSDTGLIPKMEYYYRIRTYDGDDFSNPTTVASAKTLKVGEANRSGWNLIYTDSEENGNEAEKAFDNNDKTFWHTNWSGGNPTHPHEIQIDMNDTLALVGFISVPRQDNNPNGAIREFEFYVSMDSLSWGEPVATGEWTSVKTKGVLFNQTEGRYIRLVAKSEINGNNWTSVAELGVYIQDGEPPSFKPISDKVFTAKSGEESYTIINSRYNAIAYDDFGVESLINDYNLESTLEGATFPIDTTKVTWTATDYYGNVSTISYNIIVVESSDVVTIQEVSKHKINIYPNPFNDIININFNSTQADIIQIVDLNGRILLQEENVKNSTTLDVSQLISGHYIVKVNIGDKLYTNRVVKN